MKGTV
jgi:hypothetical protein